MNELVSPKEDEKDAQIEYLSALLHRWVTDEPLGRETLELQTWRAIAEWVNAKVSRPV